MSNIIKLTQQAENLLKLLLKEQNDGGHVLISVPTYEIDITTAGSELTRSGLICNYKKYGQENISCNLSPLAKNYFNQIIE